MIPVGQSSNFEQYVLSYLSLIKFVFIGPFNVSHNENIECLSVETHLVDFAWLDRPKLPMNC